MSSRMFVPVGTNFQEFLLVLWGDTKALPLFYGTDFKNYQPGEAIDSLQDVTHEVKPPSHSGGIAGATGKRIL